METRPQVNEFIPGVQAEIAQMMEDPIGDLTAVSQPIEIKLYSSDIASLPLQAKKIVAQIEKIDGVVEVKGGVLLAGDALNVRVDPVRADVEGVAAADV